MITFTKTFKTIIKGDDCDFYLLVKDNFDKTERTEANRRKLLFRDPIFNKLFGKNDPKTFVFNTDEIEIDEVVVTWEVIFYNNFTKSSDAQNGSDISQEKGLCMEINTTDIMVVFKVPFIKNDWEGISSVGWSEKIIKDNFNIDTNNVSVMYETDDCGTNIFNGVDIYPKGFNFTMKGYKTSNIVASMTKKLYPDKYKLVKEDEDVCDIELTIYF